MSFILGVLEGIWMFVDDTWPTMLLLTGIPALVFILLEDRVTRWRRFFIVVSWILWIGLVCLFDFFQVPLKVSGVIAGLTFLCAGYLLSLQEKRGVEASNHHSSYM